MKTQTLAEKLRCLRTDSHLSQTDLAGYVGITTRQIRRYEKGEALPGPRVLRCYARTFGVSIIDLTDQRFEFGSKALFQKLKPYVESHIAATAKQIYATGKALLMLRQQAAGLNWERTKIQQLERDLEDQLLYYNKVCRDFEEALYL
ncbi:MAG: helix-turn-helix transcriptional regulator [Phycisphaerae bacterium]|nr:helix-turn-helix transcriptional regulator [Phycisphaerae bacterium]